MNKLNTPLLIVIIFLLGILLLRTNSKGKKQQEDSQIIAQQIEQVNKLISLEGNFAEVYTIDKTQKLFFDLIPIPKQAIVVAKAKTYVSYDLSHLDYELNEATKTVVLKNIPEPEVIIEPDLTFYDLKANILPFTKEELNQLNERAIELLREEAQKEDFLKLAENNLRLNLEQIIFVARQQGWIVKIEGQEHLIES